MRAASVPGLAATLLFAAVLGGAAIPAAAGVADATASDGQAAGAAAREPTTPRNDTSTPSLLAREQLFAALDQNASDYSAALYYVAGNGTWYHASPNGSIGSPAPDGAEIPKTGDTHEIPPEERPKYLWKLVSADGCDTAYYNAANVSDAAAMPIPSCPPPTPPTSTPPGTSRTPDGTASPGDGRPSAVTSDAGSTDTGTTGAAQPGFGVGGAASALLLAGWLLTRG